MEKKEKSSSALKDHLVNIKKDLKFKLKECKDTLSVESVHDVRVDLRKLMSIAELTLNFHSVNPKTRKFFKQTQKIFSDTRDIHVSIHYTKNNLEAKIEISDFLNYLESLRISRENLLADELLEFKISKLFKNIDYLSSAITTSDFSNSFISILRMKLDNSFLAVIKNIEFIDISKISTIHKVRISLKNFRYLFEIHNLLFSDENKKINILKHLQDCLGEIQDLTVLKQLLYEYGETKDANIEVLLSSINKRTNFLVKRFYENRYDILYLWEIKT